MLVSNTLTFRSAAVLTFLVLATGSCADSKSGADASKAGSEQAAAPSTQTPVQRGEHLALVSGCHDCHTPGALYGGPDFSRSLAGSQVGWQGPWGVSYAKNLTPDPTTGLGTWTDEEIIRAIQAGVRKNGAPVAPPMPWPNFARFSREDVTALVAYLRSLPPVNHAVPANTPPGTKPQGPVISVPAPPAWDAPRPPAS